MGKLLKKEYSIYILNMFFYTQNDRLHLYYVPLILHILISNY